MHRTFSFNINLLAMWQLNKSHRFTLVLSLFLIVQTGFSQEKKALTLDDYGQWKSIRNAEISPNGQWMTYSYHPNDGDSRLYIKKLDADTVHSVINGKQVDFSLDNNWVAYLSDLPENEAEKLRKQSKPVSSTLELYNLASRSVTSIENVSSYAFSKASNYLAIQKNQADRKAEHKGADLLLHDLKGNQSLNIGNVASYAFNKAGTLFAYLVDADSDNGNGLYVVDLGNLRTYSLHTGAYTYSQMSWNETGNQLAVLFGNQVDGQIERENTLFWAGNLSSGMTSKGSSNVYDPSTDAKFTSGYVISEYSSLSWNEAATQIGRAHV